MQVVQWLGVLPVAETGFPSLADYKFLEDVLLPEAKDTAKDLGILEVEKLPFQRVHEFFHSLRFTGQGPDRLYGAWNMGAPTITFLCTLDVK